MLHKHFSTLLLALVLFPFISNGQSCDDCRYHFPIFEELTIETVKFGEGINVSGSNQELFMDVYYPTGDTMDTTILRPVLVFAFGGGFISGSRTEAHVTKTCTQYAKAGYVAAAIDYRYGFDWFSIGPAELMRVFFKAMQDMRGAVQYMRAHADIMDNTWRIDTNNIFIGGASSGGITALHVAHCDKPEEIGTMADTSNLAPFGGFYATSGTYDSYSWESKGVISVAGAMFNADWVDADGPPIILAHGDEDATVPLEGGTIDLGIWAGGLEGSKLVHEAAEDTGVCSYLWIMEGEDHPSNGASWEYFNNVLFRAMPLQLGLMENRSWCCDLSTTIMNGDTAYFDDFDTTIVKATIEGEVGSPTISWCSYPCGVYGSDTAISVIPDTLDYYGLIVREPGCFAADFTYFQPGTPLSVQGGVQIQEVSVYPNPANEFVQIEVPDPKFNQLQILDRFGRQIESRNVAGREARLNIEQYSPGIYYVKLVSSDEIAVQKLIIR